MSSQSVFRNTLIVVGTLVGLYLMFAMRELILLVFIAILFASTIKPVVSFLEKYRLPRGVAILLVYLATLSLLAAFVALILPTALSRFIELARSESQIVLAAQSMLEQLSVLAYNNLQITVAVPDGAELTSRLQEPQQGC